MLDRPSFLMCHHMCRMAGMYPGDQRPMASLGYPGESGAKWGRGAGEGLSDILTL